MCETELYNGDCLELLKNIQDESVDCIITDPPYGIGYQSNMKKNKDLPMFYDRNTAWVSEYLCTGVACRRKNRRFIGMEISDEYFNSAKQRIEECEKTLF